MAFLLDTNVLSEVSRPEPNPAVRDWYGRQSWETLYVSVITLAELKRGLLLLDEGTRRRRLLEGHYRRILMSFEDRVPPIALGVAERWAEVTLRHIKAGRMQAALDELIAATGLAHDLTVVTRNVRHFEHSGCRLLSPWSG